jgi:gamma-glutamyltranspeptidase / glutathione hydrolase
VQPAVHLAQGLVVHERLAARSPPTRRAAGALPRHGDDVFLPGGRAPRVGERLVQRDLAETLRRMRSEGADGFYRGRTAELVEAEMRRGGGIMTATDLARYEAVWRDPVASPTAATR